MRVLLTPVLATVYAPLANQTAPLRAAATTGEVMGRVIAYVTQYVTYQTLCKSQYMLMTLSRAWSVPITFNHNDMSVSTVRVVHRLCVFR